MKDSQNRLVVVLGMHRSGTSAITRALELLGVGLGNNLHPAGFDNPKGFWEDRSVLEINEELLALQASATDRLGIAQQKLLPSADLSRLQLKAYQLIQERLAEENGIWGFKDPRTCRLLSFWLGVFAAAECRVSFVIALRNPASVVASLLSRNEISVEKSYWLWLQHMLPAALQSLGLERIVVDYDLFLDAPYAQLARIAKRIDLPLPSEELLCKFGSEFLEPGLRHTRFSLQQLKLDSRAPPPVYDLYQLLSSVARDEVALEDEEVLVQLAVLERSLSSTASLVEYTNSLEDNQKLLWRALSEREGQITNLSQAVTERDEKINNLSHAVTERDEQITNLNQAVTERDEKINNLSHAVTERDEQITNLSHAVTERDEQITNLNQAVTEREGQITSLSQAVSETRRELGQVLASKSWRLTKPLRFIRRVMVDAPYLATRRFLSNNARALWRALPISYARKRSVKALLFKTFPWVFRWSVAYQTWYPSNASVNCTPISDAADLQERQIAVEYVPLTSCLPLEHKPVKLICFYLPQFHAIQQNDEWWGKGFTEWSNVKPAQPQFVGHYQPHEPGELGYYSLLDPTVQRRQVELAKLYGIEGFCFYFYWFGGTRLLEAPTENYLKDKTLDLPFCLCWANENWSRRWDGLESEILISQQHSVEDDLAFIQHVGSYMQDLRYIRINGKPLLLVYRPNLLPSAKETATRWRDWCRTNGIGEIYLAYTQSFENVDPEKYGFDAAIEFPPNNSAPPNITGSVTPIGEGFGSTVYDWRVFVERSEHYKQQSYTLFRSVCPSWDNTARRKNRGTVFLNSTPTLYQRWLENAIRDTEARCSNPDERLIFVNGWNEWAEGAHLEPDVKYGYAYLQATRDALSGEGHIPNAQRKIILVTHDAYPHGAQILALNLAKTLSQGMGFHVDLVCLGDGPLLSEYAKWATVHLLGGKDPRGAEGQAIAHRLYGEGHRAALVNTTVSGLFLETLVGRGIKCVALIHELRGVIEQNRLHGHAKAIAAHAVKVIFPAAEVAESFDKFAPVAAGKLVIRPQGLYKLRDKTRQVESDYAGLRQKLDLPADAQIVLGAGYADHRKGIDLFVAAGLAVAQRLPKTYWVWIGHWEQSMRLVVEKLLSQYPESKDRFLFPGLQTDTNLFYGGADVFALTSREDPFPSVLLEALDASVPVVGFEDAGGFKGLLNEGCGKLVPKENYEAFGLTVAHLLENPVERAMLGLRGADLTKERFSFRHYVYDLLDLLGIGLARVSVIVPNYNYAHYLPERLHSIVKQDYPIYEIVFLDDCSRDESIRVAEKAFQESGIDYRIVINQENSGSVFRQWSRGVELTAGTHVWIAEADDSCDDDLISELIKGFRTPGVVLSYCESKQIDEDGNVLANNYLAYVSDIDTKHWLTPFVVDGNQEIAESLSVKNTIPNVSAVLFEKDVLTNVLTNNLDMISSYRIAGDWLTYVLVLDGGKLAFTPRPLNKHRRHRSGMTISNNNQSQLEEICRMQEYVTLGTSVPTEKVEKAKLYIEFLKEKQRISQY